MRNGKVSQQWQELVKAIKCFADVPVGRQALKDSVEKLMS
jgi:hypothetical protein